MGRRRRAFDRPVWDLRQPAASAPAAVRSTYFLC